MTSVRGDRTVYRERDTERDYEDAPRRSYTTVKRYQVPESISRSIRHDDEEVQDKIVIKRTERREDPPPPPSSHHHDDFEYRVTERRYDRSPSRSRDEVDWRFTERRVERSADPPRRETHYRVVDRERDNEYERPRSEYRVVERDTEVARAPSPPEHERVREFRFERDRSFSPQRERSYDVERYSKSTEYFAQPQPQPIIIRESAQAAPIIIREERREPQRIIIRREEPQYEFVERREVREVEETRDESRSLVKAEEPPSPEPPTPQPEKQPEEDYFYERRVIERRRRSSSRDRKSEIRPRDSASNYSSDDSYEYVRRERTYDGDEKDSHHKRHLAEGAIAGIGAAEILRHHRKSKGDTVGGRGRSAIGGAAVGALGAEALTRVRSMRSLRRASHSRSSSRDRERRSKRKPRSRSRSKSLSRAQQLGGLAAVAAVGALAGYALKNRGKNQETIIVNDGGRHHRRSRSRRRRGSQDTYDSEPVDPHRDPEHRNRRIAQAGLASAAAAGIWEKVRSKSRGGKERSKSRIRQGVPIAAAGLGGAALAGLYEKNKANKEAKKDAIVESELNRGRRRHSRSRSRSRSVPASYSEHDRRSVDGRDLIAYGQDPIHPDGHHGYHSDEEPGRYRRRGGSSSSSPDTRRRSHSRGRNLAGLGAAAGAGAVAAHEFGKHRSRSRGASRDRRHDDDDERYNDGYSNQQYSPPPMVQNGYGQPQQNAPYNQQQAYPSSQYFPPPPTGENAQDPYAQQSAYPPYNPADWSQQPQHNPYDTSRGVYGESEATLGQPHPNDTYAGDSRYDAQDHSGRGRGRQGPENVSPPNNESAQSRGSPEADRVVTPRARSTSRVRFDLDSNVTHSPEASRRKDDAKRSDPDESRRHGDGGDDPGEKKHHRRRKRKSHHSHRDSPQLMHDKYERAPEDRGSDSDDTEDLPERFDDAGNRKAEDPLAHKINELLSGQGGLGGLFKAITGSSSANNDERDDDSRSGRRRSRR